MSMNKNEKDIIELEEINVIVKIPNETIKLTINASTIDKNGDILNVEKSMMPSDIRDARESFISAVGGDDFDATYVFTEKGLEYARMLHEGATALEDLYD